MDMFEAYLGVVKSFEKRRDTDEADVVVPHDDMLLVWVIGHLEGVLEH